MKNNFRLASLRQLSIKEKRAMVSIRNIKSKKILTMAVCPACFNLKVRREQILQKLAKAGYEVISKEDKLDGIFLKKAKHAPGCPYQ